MAGKYQAYPEYRESGVLWVGDIPSHWISTKTSRFFKVAMGQTILKEELIDDGEWPVFSATEGDHYFGRVNSPNVRLDVGDIVIPARGNSIGAVKLVKEKSTTTQTTIYCKQYQIDKIKPGYAYYYFNGGRKNLFRFTQTAIPQITTEEVGSNPLLIPTADEQQKIANFLDHETAKIDTLIEKQQQLIKLLKEKRQVVISHAVTKGLNPNAPLRDSGVEWLGEVPEHWDLTKVGWMCEFISYGFTNPMPSTDEGPYMLTATDIEFGRVKYEEARRTSEEAFKTLLSPKSKPEKDDVLLTKDGTLGRVTVFNGEYSTCISQSVALLRLDKKKVISEFLSMALMGADYQRKMIFDAGGTTIKHIYISILAKMNFILPNLDEQKEILQILAIKLGKIDALIEQAQQASHLCNERRTALISAAVTGKIDVRHFTLENKREGHND